MNLAETMRRLESGRPAEGDDLTILFGGTFDPPQLGHWELAEAARKWGEERSGGRVDVIWVVADQPYHKTRDGSRHYDTATREELVELLLAQQGGLWYQGGKHRVLTNAELAEGWGDLGHHPATWWSRDTYTIDILNAGQALCEIGERPWLLLGADAAGGLATWQRYDELCERANVLVGRRKGEQLAERPAGLGEDQWRVMLAEIRQESSTRVRSLVKAGAWDEVAGACGRKLARRLQLLSRDSEEEPALKIA